MLGFVTVFDLYLVLVFVLDFVLDFMLDLAASIAMALWRTIVFLGQGYPHVFRPT